MDSGKKRGHGGKKPARLISLLVLGTVALMCGMFVFSAIGQIPNYSISNKSKLARADTHMEIADSDFYRMRGLMFRDRIIAMLFVFNSDGIYPIHSNFVAAPFDAVYLSSEGKVTEIVRKIPPGTQLVVPKKPARYLLELPPEIFDSLSIEVGDEITWKKL